MTGYEVKINATSKELSAKERIKMKDTTNCVKLDEVLADANKIMITPVAYVVLGIHNEKADDKDYEQYIIEDADGTKYLTGSNSFFDSFIDIWNEMESEAQGEEYQIEAYKVESKNYKGKYFYTCSIM